MADDTSLNDIFLARETECLACTNYHTSVLRRLLYAAQLAVQGLGLRRDARSRKDRVTNDTTSDGYGVDLFLTIYSNKGRTTRRLAPRLSYTGSYLPGYQ